MLIIYDGACPFCSSYISRCRLQRSVDQITYLNARHEDERLNTYIHAGYDFNEGMLVIIDQQIYAGADAIHVLALQSSRSDIFNRLNYWIFKRAVLAKILYPCLKFGRRCALIVLGIPLLKKS
jgi:predicted DCC family thiol-disulfide oxidoreductase YuxK